MMNKERLLPRTWEGYRKYDLFICALGYETRGRHVAKQLVDNLPPELSLALAFDSNKLHAREENENCFRRWGFDVKEWKDENFGEKIKILLPSILRPKGENESTLVGIDISCFSRLRLALLLEALSRLTQSLQIDVDFIYSLAEFVPSSGGPTVNTHVGPVTSGFAGWTSDPDRPGTAIVGLGYEQDKALGAVEHLEAGMPWLFEPVSGIEEYLVEVRKANSLLYELVDKNRVVTYSVEAPFQLFLSIENLTLSMLNQWAPILLPFGPKVFALICLLVAWRHPEVSVWRVSGEKAEPRDYVASKTVVGISVMLVAPLEGPH